MRPLRHGLVAQARPVLRDQLGRRRALLLVLGTLQILLGCGVVSVSFAALAMTTSGRVRNACPYWAGFAAMLSGGVGMIAWKQQTSLSVSFFTFLSAVCILLHVVAAVLSGESSRLLTSLFSCTRQDLGMACQCCDSSSHCYLYLEGVADCSTVQTVLKELMYAICVTSTVACLVSFLSVALSCTQLIRRQAHHRMLYGHSLASPVLPSDSLRTPVEDDTLPAGFVQPIPPPPYSPPGCYISQHGTFGHLCTQAHCMAFDLNPTCVPSEDPPPYSAVDPNVSSADARRRWTTEPQCSMDDGTRSPTVEGACGLQAVPHSELTVSPSGTLNNMLDSLHLASSFTSGPSSPTTKEGLTCDSAELQRAADLSLESVLQAFHQQTQQMDRNTTNIHVRQTQSPTGPHLNLPDATPSPTCQGAGSLERSILHHVTTTRICQDKTQTKGASSGSKGLLSRKHVEPQGAVSALGKQDNSHTGTSVVRQLCSGGKKGKAERPKTLNLSGNAKHRKRTYRNPKKRPRSLVDVKDPNDTKVLVAQFLEQPVGNLPPAVQIVVENIKSVIQSDEHHLAEVLHSASVLQEVEVRHSSYRYSLSSTSSSSCVSSSGSVYRTVEVSASAVCRTSEVSPSSSVCRIAEAAEPAGESWDVYRETVL